MSEKVDELEAIINAMNSVVLHQTDRMQWQLNKDLPKMLVHPLTCGNDSNHTPLFPFWDWETRKLLLVCRDCDYTQFNSAGHHPS